MATYLYGLILRRNSARLPSGVTGLDHAPVHVVACDELAALVSTIESIPSRQNLDALAAHDRATRMVARSAVTAAASRYGQTFADDRALCAELGAFRNRLLDTLERYDGYGEMRIIMRDAVEPPGSVPVTIAPRATTGRAYLESLREKLTPRPPVDFRAILGGLILDERVERQKGTQMIAHLVRFEDEKQYRAALFTHPALEGATITGPHALYTFAEPS